MRVDDWSIQLLGTAWEPKATGQTDEQIYRLWMDAVASPHPVPVWAVRLATGWCAEVQINTQWIEIVPKERQIADTQHMQAQHASLVALKDERRQLVHAAKAPVLQLTNGVLPELITADGTYAIPDAIAATRTSARAEGDSVLSPTSPSQASLDTRVKGAARPKVTAAPKHDPPSSTADEAMPDIAALMAAIAAQLG